MLFLMVEKLILKKNRKRPILVYLRVKWEANIM